jgi:YidC/Oxa1 family membrane protein insertase
MNFDRNTIIGFIALAVLFMAYFFYNSRGEQQRQQILAEKQRQDSLAKASQPKPDIAIQKRDSVLLDSQGRVASAGNYGQYLNGAETVTIVKTDIVNIGFSNKGGQPKWVELKNFKGPDSNNVHMAATDFDKISYTINTGDNKTAPITNFYFGGGQIVENADHSKTVTYQMQSPNGTSITHQYIIRPDNYMIDFNLQIHGPGQLFTGNTLNLTWQNKAVQLQKDLAYEKQESRVAYRVDGDFDYNSIRGNDNKELSKSVNWVSVKQQFFNSTLLAKNNFTSGTLSWVTPTSGNTIVEAIANLKVSLPSANAVTIPFGLYYGPIMGLPIIKY